MHNVNVETCVITEVQSEHLVQSDLEWRRHSSRGRESYGCCRVREEGSRRAAAGCRTRTRWTSSRSSGFVAKLVCFYFIFMLFMLSANISSYKVRQRCVQRSFAVFGTTLCGTHWYWQYMALRWYLVLCGFVDCAILQSILVTVKAVRIAAQTKMYILGYLILYLINYVLTNMPNAIFIDTANRYDVLLELLRHCLFFNLPPMYLTVEAATTQWLILGSAECWSWFSSCQDFCELMRWQQNCCNAPEKSHLPGGYIWALDWGSKWCQKAYS